MDLWDSWFCTNRHCLADERVFLNIVCSDAVEKPTLGSGIDEAAKGRSGIVVTLPHFVGPPRREKSPGEMRGDGKSITIVVLYCCTS